jgi:hypothetical protein
MRIYIFLAVMMLLSACGTTSNLRNTDNSAHLPDFTSYNTVVINDFTNGVTKKKDDAQIISEGKKFADIIATSIKKEKVFNNVERNSTSASHALLIDGEITEYEQGNSALRFMVGFGAGSSHFDAKVYFKDNVTKNILGNIDVDKQSWALGGALAATQDVKSHMESSASKIANEIAKAKQIKTPMVLASR